MTRGKDEHLFKSSSNMYELITGKLDILGKVMHDIIRQHLFNRSNNEQIGLKFDFYTDLSFFGYGKDGNRKIFDEKDPIRIYTSLVFSGCTVWVSNKKNYHDEENWIMTGSHSSCYFENWDKGVLEEIREAFDTLIPDNYWQHPEHSKRPIYVFMAPSGFAGFGEKVLLETEYINNPKDPFQSYEKIKNVRSYESAMKELESEQPSMRM